MEHLRGRRIRSSVDRMKEKETACAYGVLPFFFGHQIHQDMFLLSRMGDPYSKKKKKRQKSLGLDCNCNFHFGNRCVHTQKAFLIHIRIYLRERLKKKKKRKGKNSWRVGHSSKAFNGDQTCTIFFCFFC